MGKILLCVFVGLLALVYWRIVLNLALLALTGLVLSGLAAVPSYVGVPVFILLIIFGLIALAKDGTKEAEESSRKEQQLADQQRQLQEQEQQEMDADIHFRPYTFKTGRHANETLAIRYGIANQEKKTKKYWYYGPGGEKKRNPDRDRFYYEPAPTIKLQKTKKRKKDLYEVLLTDYRDRKALAVIELGTNYVKTFYPLDESWFKKHVALEETLKGNVSFSLKELATFHVQKAVGVPQEQEMG